ncbi:volume-regulated anion channel subunit LRRC8C-like [Ambystoma mexicanum]|uniref:volume-regulated anion channel subunit LRRC8C-like n=1 Tax=Ambystoma mexicanum TaxID=8296 RepID=UPI0037E801FF
MDQIHEWEIDTGQLSKVFEKWGRPPLDLFATKRNKKCEMYASRWPQECSLGEAFSFPWTDKFLYAIPPFPLIQRTLQWIRSPQAKPQSLVISLAMFLGNKHMISYEKVVCCAVPPGLSLPDNVWNLTALAAIKDKISLTGFKTNLDLQYFALINTWCYDNYVTAFTKFFPYLILINSLIFLISSNFWFKFPGTSSKIEHFLSVLGKCLNSPWTAKALSATMYEDAAQSSLKFNVSSKNPKAVGPSMYAFETEGKYALKGENVETLTDEETPTDTIMKRTTSKQTLGGKVESKPEQILDKKEGEQAKALFEKVKKFRVHTEEKDILYQMYKRQAFLRAVESIVFIVYISIYVPSMKFVSHCIDELNMTGFTQYYCVHGMWRMYTMISTVYLILLCIYTCLVFVNFYWIFHSNLKEYSFERIRKEYGIDDIPDVINDFAFLLHLIDQYDTLYSREFAVFLSDVSETKLLQLNLNNYWTIEKLKQSLSIDSQGKTELHLFMMPGIPSQVFELDEIEVLKLENVDMTIPASISKLKALNELWLYNCSIKLNSQALVFLKKNLEVLKVRFSTSQELPSWLYHLGKIQWLYLHGHLQVDKGSINVHSFREMKQIQFLYLKLSIGTIPSPIMELAATVSTLIIHNEGTKLLSLTSFKMLKKLRHLGLIQCKLDKIPNFIFSLSDLEEIDLEDNNLKSLEELASLQHFKRVRSLKFSRNRITSIPPHIGQITNVEHLYLNNNLITALNPNICNLKKLTYLDISYNSIQVLPEEIGQLQELHYFFASYNYIDQIPEELFTCVKLEKLTLAQNTIATLSPLVGNLINLRLLDLTGNRLESLPQELEKCTLLTKTRLQVEKEVYATLPVYVREQLLKDEHRTWNLKKVRDFGESPY